LGGRASFKALHECLKLHLPTSFASTSLLTRGYFLILFDSEEGAITTKKLTTVDSSELNLSFSRFSPDFDASAQGAEALLMHTIKVQFPDLHEQFRNAKALTIMASKFGEVLDIEAKDSYIKRPAGPMVTVEVQDILRLAGFIKIPSMFESASTANTIRQKILYSGLPNQCRKCCKFGHHARAYNKNLVRPQEGPAHHNPPRRVSPRGAPNPSGLVQNSISSVKLRLLPSARPEPQEMKGGKPREEALVTTDTPLIPSQSSSGRGNSDLESPVQVVSPRIPERNGQSDHEMSDPPESAACPKTEPHTKKEQCSTSTLTPIKPPFDFPTRVGPKRETREETFNPFATPEKKGKEAPGPSDPPSESMEGWVFQGKKMNAPIRAPPKQESPQAFLRTPQKDVTLSGKRGRLHSEVHQSYLTSLGISVSTNKEPFRVRFWPVLTRDKDTQREMLMHSKSHTLPSLPLSIRYSGPAGELEAGWTPNEA
jgi:hypothetical protein